jgi:hypothetical protein
MNQMKSSNQNARAGIVRAMQPLWRVGIPATAALSAVLAGAFAVVLDGCSRNKSNGPQLTSSGSASIPQGAAPAAEVTSPPHHSNGPLATRKRSIVEHRAPTTLFADGAYGVSFRYPRNYLLVTPDRANLSLSLKKIPMNFIQPGGVSLATVARPDGPVTLLFHMNVNKGMKREACQQFAVPHGSSVSGGASVDLKDGGLPARVILGGVDFTRVESGTAQNELRYYHHFENGVCYEVAMAVEDGTKRAVDHLQLFDQLEQIMPTVRITSPTSPATAEKLSATRVKKSEPSLNK